MLRYFVLLLSFLQLGALQAGKIKKKSAKVVHSSSKKKVIRSTTEIMNKIKTGIEKKKNDKIKKMKKALSTHSVKVIDFCDELVPLLKDGLKISPLALDKILSDTNLFEKLLKSCTTKFEQLNSGDNSAEVYRVDIQKANKWSPLVIVKKLCDIYDDDKKSILEKKENKQQNINTMQKNLGRVLWDFYYNSSLFLQHVQLQRHHLPKVCLVEAYVTYNDKNGDSHLLEIIHAAAGKSINELLESTISIEELTAAYKAVGRSLSLVHQAGMTPINGAPHEWRSKFVHGDFHLQNMFYNNGKVSFIDNESNAEVSSKGCTIAIDVNEFLLVPLLYWDFNNESKKRSMLRHLEASNGFLTGYINAYPIAVRKELAQYYCNEQLLIFFKKAFNEPISHEIKNRFTSGWGKFDWLRDQMLEHIQDIAQNSKDLLVKINEHFEVWLIKYIKDLEFTELQDKMWYWEAFPENEEQNNNKQSCLIC